MFATQIAVAIERVLFSQEIRRTEVELEADRLRSSLLRAISGELRTPLGVITGATSMLLEKGDELEASERRELAEEVHDQAERLNRLVRNLLEITRLASGTLRLQKERQPIDEIIRVTLQRLEPRLVGRQVLLSLPPDLRPVPLDDVLMEQVFFNLLDNALKYTPPGSPISISAAPTAFGIEVEVADRGLGIPAPERERIFDRFYRVGGDRPEAGTGIGLAICRGVIEAHGGRIWVEDREGGGSRFRFTLPLENVALQAAESVTRPLETDSPHPAP
jgi:two-component system sensor histidine kinase KdpD